MLLKTRLEKDQNLAQAAMQLSCLVSTLQAFELSVVVFGVKNVSLALIKAPDIHWRTFQQNDVSGPHCRASLSFCGYSFYTLGWTHPAWCTAPQRDVSLNGSRWFLEHASFSGLHSSLSSTEIWVSLGWIKSVFCFFFFYLKCFRRRNSKYMYRESVSIVLFTLSCLVFWGNVSGTQQVISELKPLHNSRDQCNWLYAFMSVQ